MAWRIGTEVAPRGGVLALEQRGSTRCLVAVHALEQAQLPAQPAMHTEHDAAALRQHVTVGVGKRHPGNKKREKLKSTELFTGFTQLDDGNGTIVPDGSVRRLLQVPRMAVFLLDR